MTSKTHARTRLGAAAVVLIAMIVGGCLQAEKRIGIQYDRATDRFTFLVVFNHISSDKLVADGGDPDGDSAYLKTLWSNRDHLILLPSLMQPVDDSDEPLAMFTNDGLGFLRLSASRFAQISLGGAAATQPQETSLPLDTIQIKPGELFNEGGSNLSYYHQIVVPGALVDKALDMAAKAESKEIVAAVDDEIASRGAGVATGTWKQIADGLIERISAVPDDPSAQAAPNAPEPAGMPHGFSLDSLRMMKQALGASGKLDLWRSGSTLTVKMPMTAEDAAGIVANWPAVRDAALAKISSKAQKALAASAGDSSVVDPKPAAIALAQSTKVAKDESGLVVSVDVVSLGQFLSDWDSLDVAMMSDEDRSGRDNLSRELGAVAATKMPVNEKLTVARVMADFAKGTLASVPATQPVKPGTGLEINP
jgi:hypothetical protein